MAIKRAFAQEDTNLQTNTVKGSRARVYKDIDLSFTKKPVSGEIYKKEDSAAVKQAVKTLLMTNFLEKPFQPQYGGDIIGQLFELADDDIDEEIEKDNGITISKIFETKGETFFRKIEEDITLKVLKKSNCVISLGGGAFLNKNLEKTVIAPSPWFGFRNLNDTKDLLPNNYCLGEVECALGTKLLERLDEMNAQKRSRAIRFIDELKEFKNLIKNL